MSKIVTITSGKGGVGKTNLSLNLGLCLSRMGHRTCLFDADLGLANINILLGLHPEYDLKDVLSGSRTLQEIIIRTEDGLEILPGTSGVEEMANLSPEQVEALIRSFADMARYEFLLFDTSAGISRNVISFCLASSEVILVVTPEPTSMTDAFALLKVLYLNGFGGEARVVLNQCKTAEAGRQAYARFRAAVSKYLGKELVALGMVMEDEKLTDAVRIQRPLQIAFPNSSAAKSIQKIADRLVANGDASSDSMDMEGFWRRCLQAVRGPLRLPVKAKETRSETASPTSRPYGPASEPQGPRHLDAAPVPNNGPKPVQPGPGQVEVHERVLSVTLGKDEGLKGSSLPPVERLIESISSVSREIQLIREMIGGNGAAFFREDGDSKGPRVNPSPQPIRLDLDAFLKKIRTEGKE